MTNEFKRVSVVGLGYIGLPTAVLVANHGVDVVGVDINSSVVETLNAGRMHIVEPGLDALLHAAVVSGKFRATLHPEAADVFLIAVPTPCQGEHKADLSYIRAAAHAIAKILKKGNVVVLESTSPVGTTESLEAWLASDRPDLSFPSKLGDESDIRIAYCPERVLPGKVVHELIENDRVVGGISNKCTETAIAFYKTFVQGKCLGTNVRTAEMSKLTENAFRDVNIAFANELSLICERLGINVWELIELANHHPRVKILRPGPGVGGHCIAVDPWFIVESAPDLAKLIHTARLVNDTKPSWVVEKIKAMAKRFKASKIACLGLTFKPDIDDLRGSPALKIIVQLAQEVDGRILVVEPYINVLPTVLEQYKNVELRETGDAILEADIVVLLVKHQSFEQVDRKLLEGKSVIDMQGVWR